MRVNTINGAYNSHEEAIKGYSTAEKLGDFVVLSDDVLAVDQERIKDLQVVRAGVGGPTVCQA
jgi:predicted amidohydrolase YtcJ